MTITVIKFIFSSSVKELYIVFSNTIRLVSGERENKLLYPKYSKVLIYSRKNENGELNSTYTIILVPPKSIF